MYVVFFFMFIFNIYFEKYFHCEILQTSDNMSVEKNIEILADYFINNVSQGQYAVVSGILDPVMIAVAMPFLSARYETVAIHSPGLQKNIIVKTKNKFKYGTFLEI